MLSNCREMLKSKKIKINVKTVRLCKKLSETERNEVKPKKLLTLTSESKKKAFFCIQKRKFQAKKALKNKTTKACVGKFQVLKKLEN